MNWIRKAQLYMHESYAEDTNAVEVLYFVKAINEIRGGKYKKFLRTITDDLEYHLGEGYHFYLESYVNEDGKEFIDKYSAEIAYGDSDDNFLNIKYTVLIDAIECITKFYLEEFPEDTEVCLSYIQDLRTHFAKHLEIDRVVKDKE